MTPRQALARLGMAAQGVCVLRLIHRAATKRSYLVERRRERLVLRVDEPLAGAWRLDRHAEVRVLRAAATAGVGPELIASNLRAPAVLLLRYLPGRAWQPADLCETKRLGQLAGLLRRVHAIRITGRPLDLPAVAMRYAERSGNAMARRLAGQVATLLRAPGGLVAADGPDAALCHHDPIAANIIGLRSPQLIDWEYAAGGDPLFDLAAVIRHHRLPARASRSFLAAYFGGVMAIPSERLAAQRAIYDRILMLWLWALERDQPLTAAQRHWLALAGRAVASGARPQS